MRRSNGWMTAKMITITMVMMTAAAEVSCCFKTWINCHCAEDHLSRQYEQVWSSINRSIKTSHPRLLRSKEQMKTNGPKRAVDKCVSSRGWITLEDPSRSVDWRQAELDLSNRSLRTWIESMKFKAREMNNCVVNGTKWELLTMSMSIGCQSKGGGTHSPRTLITIEA